MFGIIGWLIFGLVVGLIARAVMPGRNNMSLPITAGLGIVGALVAGWLGRALGWYGPDDGAGFISATIGAVIVLAVYHAATRRRSVLGSSTTREFPRKVA